MATIMSLKRPRPSLSAKSPNQPPWKRTKVIEEHSPNFEVAQRKLHNRRDFESYTRRYRRSHTLSNNPEWAYQAPPDPDADDHPIAAGVPGVIGLGINLGDFMDGSNDSNVVAGLHYPRDWKDVNVHVKSPVGGRWIRFDSIGGVLQTSKNIAANVSRRRGPIQYWQPEFSPITPPTRAPRDELVRDSPTPPPQQVANSPSYAFVVPSPTPSPSQAHNSPNYTFVEPSPTPSTPQATAATSPEHNSGYEGSLQFSPLANSPSDSWQSPVDGWDSPRFPPPSDYPFLSPPDAPPPSARSGPNSELERSPYQNQSSPANDRWPTIIQANEFRADAGELQDEAACALFITEWLDELTDREKAWADADLELFHPDRAAWVQGSPGYVRSIGEQVLPPLPAPATDDSAPENSPPRASPTSARSCSNSEQERSPYQNQTLAAGNDRSQSESSTIILSNEFRADAGELFMTDELDELTDGEKAWADADLALFHPDRAAWVQGSRGYVRSIGEQALLPDADLELFHPDRAAWVRCSRGGSRGYVRSIGEQVPLPDADLELFHPDRAAWVQGSRGSGEQVPLPLPAPAGPRGGSSKSGRRKKRRNQRNRPVQSSY